MSCFKMCDKCETCKHYQYIPATYDEPSEEYCLKDMDEFYEEEEVECSEYEEAWTKEDWEAANYNWNDHADEFHIW